jgi:hypothetical protein
MDEPESRSLAAWKFPCRLAIPQTEFNNLLKGEEQILQ